jgi:hypothetical protein
MSSGRHLHRPLFSLYKQLDRQRDVQRSIKFAECSTIVLKITRWLSIGMCLKPCFQESNGNIQTANFSPSRTRPDDDDGVSTGSGPGSPSGQPAWSGGCDRVSAYPVIAQSCRPLRELITMCHSFLGLAPQALCCRPLCRLGPIHFMNNPG